MGKVLLIAAAFSGMSAVILGAFGAHGLKSKLTTELMQAYQTGVSYQFYHTLAILVVVLLMRHETLSQSNMGYLQFSGCLFVLGIVLFSGSLYCLALGGPKWLGPITPIGGLCFIAAWLSLFVAAIKS